MVIALFLKRASSLLDLMVFDLNSTLSDMNISTLLCQLLPGLSLPDLSC